MYDLGSVVGSIPIVGPLINSAIGMDATRKSTNQASDAAQNAINTQYGMYNQMRTDLAPWRTSGTNALNTLTGMVNAGPGNYQKSPYYDFLQSEGVKSLDRSGAAKGMQLSGAQQKGVERFGQNLASTDYDAWLNRWYQSLVPYQNLATMGQNAATTTGQNGLQTGQLMGNMYYNQGQTQAAGTLGQSRNWQNLVTGGGNSLTSLFGGGNGGQAGLNGLVGNTALSNSLIGLV